MSFFIVSRGGGTATVTLSRGKVNALNESVVDELRNLLAGLAGDAETRAVILTGRGKFFSFGFDIPGFIERSREEFVRFLGKFTSLIGYMFLYPKPLIAALNGHTVAGGCMLALACDRRLMVPGKAKISLNEIAFGSTVFAGSLEMLRFHTGNANAATILYSGAMYSAEEAFGLGLIDAVSQGADLISEAAAAAAELGGKAVPAFRSIKMMLRGPIAERIEAVKEASISEFIDIWYSDETWEQVKKIEIY